MKRIMIVDDEFLVRIGIKSMVDWEAHGYQIVAEATNGQDAAAQIPSARPQIILTDLVMEPMDGLELIGYCAEHYPDIQTVALSNYNDFEKVKSAMKLGARDFFFKLTANPQELIRVLDALSEEIDRRRLGQREAEQLISRNAGAIRKRLVNVMLESAYASEEELIRELNMIDVGCDFTKPYTVLLAKLADVCLIAGEDAQRSMLIATLESMAREHFLLGTRGQIFRLQEDRIAIVVNPEPGGDAEEFLGQMQRRFSTLDALAQRYMGTSVLGALSGRVAGVARFPFAVAEAEEGLSSRCFLMKANRLAVPCAAGYAVWDEAFSLPKWRAALSRRAFDEARAHLDALFEALYDRSARDVNRLREGLYQCYDTIRQDAAACAIHLGDMADARGVTPYQAIFQGDRLSTVEQSLLFALAAYRTACGAADARPTKREIARVVSYVRANLKGDLSVTAAARQAHMSESYFSRLFKSEMGAGYVEYVNAARMEKARELLSQSDLRIGEIAAAVGMDNPNYFTILFKKHAGMPPNEYRNRQAGGAQSRPDGIFPQ